MNDRLGVAKFAVTGPNVDSQSRPKTIYAPSIGSK